MGRQLFIDLKACSKVRRQVLYNILIEFGMPMKLLRLIKICLNETCGKVRASKNLPYAFPIQNDLSPLLFNFAVECANQESSRKSGSTGIEWNTSTLGLC
jgi:hypothetical protein